MSQPQSHSRTSAEIAALHVEHLSMAFRDGHRAVDDVSFEVRRGDVFGFLGPNGAGKTTTIRMLTGIYRPTSGSIRVCGLDVGREPVAVRRLIGVLPESSGYYDWMTAPEYLSYFSRLFRLDRATARRRIRDLLGIVSLSEHQAVPVRHYSRGMKQRLGIAKALINDPQVLFLDEPTLGLDPAGQRDIQRLLGELNRSRGMTVFITSHLLKDVEAVCNRIAILDRGRMVVEGTLADLRARYTGGDVLKMRTGDNALARSVLSGAIPEDVLHLRAEGDHLYLTIAMNQSMTAEEVKKAIIHALITHAVDILELARVETTVEDIFFKALGTSQDPDPTRTLGPSQRHESAVP